MMWALDEKGKQNRAREIPLESKDKAQISWIKLKEAPLSN